MSSLDSGILLSHFSKIFSKPNRIPSTIIKGSLFSRVGKVLEIKEKKKLVFNGKSPSKVGVAPSYLIAHVAKNDYFSKEFSGVKIIEEALFIVDDVRRSIGGKLIILDSICIPKVMDLYKQFGFREIGETFTSQIGQELQLMVLSMPNSFD
ncbi:hypothetical protein [Enterococcus mundtii]|uniref:hypothetical protein n=1 Tax=Enterococcus mundtii TaxID=53346 RepID=UPI0015E3BA5E|nr:hypothetical protein [Enterococcus mundtii]